MKYDSGNNIKLLLSATSFVGIFGFATVAALSYLAIIPSALGIEIAAGLAIAVLSVLLITAALKLFYNRRIKNLEQEVLRSSGASEAEKEEYYTELLKSSDEKVIKIILDNKENFKEAIKEYGTPIEYASSIGNKKAVKILIDREITEGFYKGKEVDLKGEEGKNAIIQAVRNEQISVLRLLVRSGTIVDVEDDVGDSLIMIAAMRDYKDILEELIAAKAPIEEKDRAGDTALIVAASWGMTGVFDILIGAGANIDEQNHQRETALMKAVSQQNEYMVRRLLKVRADVNKVNNEGNTALILAAMSGNAHTVRMLLKESAIIDKENNEGNTALIYAVLNKNIDTVSMLLKAGADIDIKNTSNQTALDIADKLSDCKGIKHLLEKAAQEKSAGRRIN